jgi:hypothetical protein
MSKQPKCAGGMETQGIIFDNAKWTVPQAKKWLKEHGYKSPKVDRAANRHRFRQVDPSRCKRGTFRTIRFGPPKLGIQAIICCPKWKKTRGKRSFKGRR